MDRPIYLDYNATTPIDPAVFAALRPYLEREFGNPSSGHVYGARAHAALDRARGPVASLLGSADPGSIVFTGSGSEADNLALKGVFDALGETDGHLITSAIEHPAVLNVARYLERRRGVRLTVLPVDGQGQVDPEAVRRAIAPDTRLVSIMHANNETGVIQPIAAIADIAHERGVLIHTDAAQTVGKLPTRVDELGVDLLTVAAHKLYAPKGIGALYVRPGTPLSPLIHGAGHEGGRRAGTENVAYAVALGAAAAIAQERLPTDLPRIQGLRDRLEQALVAEGWLVNGHPSERLPNTCNISRVGLDGEALLARVPTVAASTGSACHAGRTEPSVVLLAMGLAPTRALGALRLSLGRHTTAAEVDRAAELLLAATRVPVGS